MQIRPVAFVASMLIALCPVVTPAQAAQTCPPGMSIGACFDKVIDDLEKRVAALEAAKGMGGGGSGPGGTVQGGGKACTPQQCTFPSYWDAGKCECVLRH